MESENESNFNYIENEEENYNEQIIEKQPKKKQKKLKRPNSKPKENSEENIGDNDSFSPDIITENSKNKSKKKNNKEENDNNSSSSYSSYSSDEEKEDSKSSSSFSSCSCSSSNDKSSTQKNSIKEDKFCNYDEQVKWKLYETDSIKKDLKGHTNFYTDWTHGIKPNVPKFRVKNLPKNFPENPKPIDCFSLFFTDDLWEHIANQTNLYVAQRKRDLLIEAENEEDPNKKKKKKDNVLAKFSSWKNISIKELKLANAIFLWSGMLSNAQMEDNWSTRLLFKTNYGLVMRRTKFSMINSFLHLNNNEFQEKQDKLYKIRPVIEYLNNKFKYHYEVGNSVSIDEGMIKFNGLVSFKQYIKIKPVRYGVKAFLIADSFNYYCHKFVIYSGNIKNEFKEGTIPKSCENFSTTEQLVLYLCEGMFNKNKIVYMDNYYTTVKLAKFFTEHKTGLIGTMRRNRIKLDKNSPMPEKHGQYSFFLNQDLDMTLVIYNDKSLVYILSNVELPRILAPKLKHKKFAYGKPNCIMDYNMGARGVDFCNRRTTKYRYGHKIFKWWKACYLHLLHLAVSNSFAIYHEFKQKDLKEGEKVRRVDYKDYYASIVESLIGNITQKTKQKENKNLHLFEFIDPAKKSMARRKCKMCDKKTTWKCDSCSFGDNIVPLCIPYCFRAYHQSAESMFDFKY